MSLELISHEFKTHNSKLRTLLFVLTKTCKDLDLLIKGIETMRRYNIAVVEGNIESL